MATARDTNLTMWRDANANPIPLSNGFVVADVTGTPITSPIAAAASTITLVWPGTATRLWVRGATQDIRLGVEATVATYVTLTFGEWYAVAGRFGDSVYIGRPNSTVVDFLFEVVD